jgi:hypothetical protein
MITLNDIPPGYVKIEPGEDMSEIAYYRWHFDATNPKDIANWKCRKSHPKEKRTDNDESVWFIHAIQPPKVKPIFKEITDINIGDVFAYQSTGEPVIVNVEKYALNEVLRKYVLLGFADGLTPFSCSPVNKEGMISYLNLNKYIYITSIAPQIEKTLKLARKIALEGK